MNSRRPIAIAVTAAMLLGGVVACSPLATLNALSPQGDLTRTENVAYGDNPRQQLDIYVQAGKPDTPRAVVVFFYGGSWNDGSRSDYRFVGAALAARGYIAVLPDYRVYPEVRYPGFVEDSARAVAWTLQHIAGYGGDLQRVFVMGHSAGAYNAAMVALDGRWLKPYGASPAQLRGFIGLAGPYDFLPIENPDVKPVFWFPDSPPDSQPIHHVTRAAPPALLIASHRDKLVEADRNTGGLATLLRQQQVPVQELYYDNTSHAVLVATLAYPLRWLAPTLDTVDAFVAQPPARTAP